MKAIQAFQLKNKKSKRLNLKFEAENSDHTDSHLKISYNLNTSIIKMAIVYYYS